VRFVVLFALATIPLLFGAVHPFVQGMYTAILLVGCGGWLLLNLPALDLGQPWIRRLAAPAILLLYTAFTSLPLPLALVRILSPGRAAAIAQVNELAATDVQWLSLSYAGLGTFKETIFYLAILLFFVCLRFLLRRDRKFADHVIRVLVLVGCLEAVYGILQVVSPSLGVLWLPNRYKSACGTIIYKNQYAALLNLCWPMALAVGLGFYRQRLVELARYIEKHGRRGASRLKRELAEKSNQAPVYWFATSLIMLAVLFSLSRAGVVSMLFVWILITAFLPFSRGRKLLAFASVLILVVAFGSILGFEQIIQRFALLDTAGQARIRLWLGSASIIADYPWTGIGLESYKMLSPVYLQHFPGTVIYDRVHNEYLELIIELGIPAAAALFLWIVLQVADSLVRLWRIRDTSFSDASRASLLAVSSLAAICGFLLHGTVDFAWRLPANLLLCATLAALFSSALDRARGKKHQFVQG